MAIDVLLLFKIAGVGIIVALMATILKQAGKDDQGQLVTLVGFLLVIMIVASLLGKFFGLVRTTFGM